MSGWRRTTPEVRLAKPCSLIVSASGSLTTIGSLAVGSVNKGKAIKVVVILITLAVTILSMWYVNRKMDEAKHRVVYARRKARYVVCIPFVILSRLTFRSLRTDVAGKRKPWRLRRTRRSQL